MKTYFLPSALRGIGFAACSLTLLCVTTLAGCGGNEVDGVLSPTPTPTPTATPSPSPSVSPSPRPSASPSPSVSPSPTPSPSPTVITTASGLMYQNIVVGTGAEATAGKTATVKYVGTFTDGRQFDAGTFPFVIDSGGAIAGFNEGVKGMKVGGKRKLMVPANLAYGASGQGSIPPNTPLNFDVELNDVK